MALSMSVSAGKHNDRHNTDLEYRATLENVDPELSADNVVLADEAIGDAYARLFGEALERYNDRQRDKHPERVIEDYHAKIDAAWRADQAKVESGAKGRGNVPQPSYEYVIQIGNHDTWKSVPRDTLTEIYTETFERLKAKTAGAIDWHQAVIHYDEPLGSGHLHVDGIAYGTGNKRGLETQVSMNQALKALGLKRLPDLQNLIMVELEDVAHEHGIERDVMECDRSHQDVAAYKQTQRDVAVMTDRLEKKTAQVEQVERRLEHLQQREVELAGEVADLEAKAVEPAGETLVQSAGTLFQARGDGEREEALAGEIDQLRERIRVLEGGNSRARDRVVELDRELPGLRARCERARERFELVERRVTEVIQRLREVPEIVSDWALDIARKLGKRTYDPNSLDYMKRQAIEAARGMSSARGWEPRQRPTHGAR